jgi:hypothetical protein
MEYYLAFSMQGGGVGGGGVGKRILNTLEQLPPGQNSLGNHFSLPGKTMSSLIMYKALCWEKDLLIL